MKLAIRWDSSDSEEEGSVTSTKSSGSSKKSGQKLKKHQTDQPNRESVIKKFSGNHVDYQAFGTVLIPL